MNRSPTRLLLTPSLVGLAALAACSSGPSATDGPLVDGGSRDAPVDFGEYDARSTCEATQTPANLVEDQCPDGGGICFIDHQPTDFF